MLIYSWDKELELGVALLDQQHRQVLECINRFFIQRKCRHGKEDVETCLRFLQQYILYHFQSEEAYQVQSGYPNYRQHQALHKSLATHLTFFAVKLRSSNYDEPIVQEFYEFLVDWVTHHVMMEDRSFADHYRRYLATLQGSAPAPPLHPAPPVQDLFDANPVTTETLTGGIGNDGSECN